MCSQLMDNGYMHVCIPTVLMIKHSDTKKERSKEKSDIFAYPSGTHVTFDHCRQTTSIMILHL